MNSPETTPVIVGIGELTDHPPDSSSALEPLALMDKALRAANGDAGGNLLERIESVDVVGFVTWRYRDPVGLLCQRLGIKPARAVNTSMGGETPIRLIHEAALRIAKGEIRVAAIVGAEAMNSMNRARKERATLDWTPLVSKEEAARFAFDGLQVSAVGKQLGITEPTQIYPLFEMAYQAARGQAPRTGTAEAADLWSQFAAVAAKNPSAWIRTSPTAKDIQTSGPDNRMIAWPYPKLMVANPSVNQAAAVIVTSLAAARKAGVREDRIVHIWGGAAAAEADDYLQRDRFDHCPAQTATLAKAVEIAGGDAKRFDKLELYSCFPVVPKMALRTLELDPSKHAPTAAGGLTFFGGPLNNYMSHAVCAMVRELRVHTGEVGLLYGQGGVMTKHHALVVSTQPSPAPLAHSYSVQNDAARLRGPLPEILDRYTGPANIETYTVIYARDGVPLHGIVVLRTPAGARTMARVMRDDATSLALLTALDRSAIGASGHVRIDVFGKPVWESGALRDRKAQTYRYARVEREGPLTIVTINRAEAMNALHPSANAELAEIFDDFAADPDQWVAILTGAGDRAFSAGNDLKFTAIAMARGEAVEAPVAGFGGITARFDLVKPVIAAVNGVAMGGGFEIALACDLIIASETAIFALPEPKVGLAALAGGLHRLPREIGLKRAMGMILTARRVTAAEGRELGFVHDVTSPQALMTTARALAQQIIECSPMSIRASKDIIQRGLNEPTLEAAYRNQMHYPAAKALFRSADVREGPLAFAQKRAPKWQGK
ncbi:MAG: enoyl-CoA hydratase-related protein [Steroidobacteraceae bacterium]